MKRLGFVIVLIGAVMLMGCEKAKVMPIEGQKQDVTATAGSVNLATIAIYTADKIVNITAELAVTDEERMKGLMGRESIPANFGMWFVFPSEVQDAFWMKDTLIPLDMIFVGSDMKIVDIIANAVPRSEELLRPKAPYNYVLEVNGGVAAADGIAIGDSVEKRIGPAQ